MSCNIYRVIFIFGYKYFLQICVICRVTNIYGFVCVFYENSEVTMVLFDYNEFIEILEVL